MADQEVSTSVVILDTTTDSDDRSNNSNDIDVMALLSIIVASIGIVSKGTVVVAFLNHTKLRRKIPTMFIINQSLLDLVVSVVLLLNSITVKDAFAVNTTGILASIECGMWNSQLLLWGFLISSTWNIVTGTFERYLEIVHPIWHKTNFKISWIYISFVIIWLFGCMLTTAIHIPTTKVVNGECLVQQFYPTDLTRSAVGVFLIVVEFILPIFILLYCYGRILWVLTRRIDNNLSNQNNRFEVARRNTVKTFVLIGVSFIICWGPDQIYLLLYNLGFEMNIDINSSFIKFVIFLVYLNCTINPFIYIIKYEDYHFALKKLFRCRMTSDREELHIKSSGSSSSVTVIITSSVSIPNSELTKF